MSSPGAQKELVVNGGFNEVKDGKTVAWNEVKAHYAYRDGVGRSGTRALCFENDDPKFYSFPGQPVDLKAGCCYEYEVWVKTEHLTGDGSGASSGSTRRASGSVAPMPRASRARRTGPVSKA